MAKKAGKKKTISNQKSTAVVYPYLCPKCSVRYPIYYQNYGRCYECWIHSLPARYLDTHQ